MARTRYVQVDGQLVEVSSDRTNSLMEAFEDPRVMAEYITRVNAVAPPDRMYHYTDAAGLEAILRSGTLWFTDVFRLNDPGEIRYGLGAACAHLAEAGRLQSASDIEKEFATTVCEKLQENVESSANYFVSSCSFERDHENQWTKYGGNGRGYALAFDAGVLERHFMGVAPSNHSTFPISYAAEEMQGMQREIVTQGLAIVRAVGPHMGAALLRRISVRISVNILHCAIFFKAPNWASEREYRFMMVHRGDIAVSGVKTRLRGDTEVRYCEYDWKTGCAAALREIVVGPQSDAGFAERLCAELLPGQPIAIQRSVLSLS
jgi:hypothetical protein